MLRFLILFTLLSLSACTSTSGYLLTFYSNDKATPDHFQVCHGYSCRYRVDVNLPKSYWQEVTQLFQGSDTVSTPEQERAQIAKAIALLERRAGQVSGIEHDLAKSQKTKDTYGQQDCIDETVNTTTYLRLLQTRDLLRWHRVSTPARRGYFVDGRWPHNSATILETTSGQQFSVDSWPRANGELPDITPVAAWYQEG